MIMCPYALVVQRIGLRIADPVIEVRFLAGAQLQMRIPIPQDLLFSTIYFPNITSKIK